MIRIQDLTPRDVGKVVSYTPYPPPRDGLSDHQTGFISSWNEQFIFVRYLTGVQATKPEDLNWVRLRDSKATTDTERHVEARKISRAFLEREVQDLELQCKGMEDRLQRLEEQIAAIRSELDRADA